MDRHQLLFTVLYFLVSKILANEMVITMQKFEMCDDKDYSTTVSLNFTKKGVYHIVDLDANLTLPLDNSFTAEYVIEMSSDGEQYTRLISTKYRFCTGLRMNFGEFIYKPFTAAGVPSRCPIPAGHYSLHNFTVDFRTFPLQQLPTGYIKLLLKILSKDKKIVHCSITVSHVTFQE